MHATTSGTMIDQSFRQIVDQLAARAPKPGAGAAAGLHASFGVALFQMAIRFSRGKPANVDRDADLQQAEQTLGELQERILTLPERDCASFDHIAGAYRLPRDSAEQRDVRNRAIEEAMAGAMVVPEETLCLVRDAFVAVDEVAACLGKNIVNDLGAGAEALRAASESSFLNVRVHAAYLQHRDLARKRVDRALVVREEILRHHGSIMGVVDGLLA